MEFKDKTVYANAHLKRAEAYYYLGEHEKAVDDLSWFLEKFPRRSLCLKLGRSPTLAWEKEKKPGPTCRPCPRNVSAVVRRGASSASNALNTSLG